MTPLDNGPGELPLELQRSTHQIHRLPGRLYTFNLRTTLGNLLIVGLWLWLFRPIYGHLSIIFTREDFRTNQLILIGILVLLALRLRQDRAQLQLDAPLRFHAPALTCVAIGALGFLAVERWLDINILAACLFGLGTYGLLGLWMTSRSWREGLPAALLLIGALPFGDFIQVFIGYPMRIITAEIVRHGLTFMGAPSLGLDTILVFENSVAQVDLPCSGVKSLWTGGLFIIAATWIERRPINLRWLLIACLFGILLFVANLARVAILVSVGQALGLTLLAELLHVPLGVIGFVGACAAAVLLLKSSAPRSSETAPHTLSPNTSRPLLTGVLVFALAGCNLAYTARPTLAPAALAPTNMALPATLMTQPIVLRPGELDWLTNDGAEAVERVRFEWPSLSSGKITALTGSMLLVQSTSWRAHHKPERCFENYGLRVEESQAYVFGEDETAMPVRLMSLTNGKPSGQLTALYWFQSHDSVTDDYGLRLWSAMSLRPERWMLVTVLFDQPYDVNAPGEAKALRTLTLALREAVHMQLTTQPSS